MSKLFNQASLEEIDFQLNDGFTSKLRMMCDEIHESISSHIDNREEFFRKKNHIKVKKELAALIAKRFGFTVNINWSKDLYVPAAIVTPRVYTNHILTELKISDFKLYTGTKWLKNVKLLDDHFRNSKLKINLAKATVSGYPKKIPMEMFFDFFQLVNDSKLTSGELVATVLHEIGHGFTFLEMLDRTSKVNQVLTGVLDKVINGKDVKEYEYEIRDSIPDKESRKDYVTLDKSGNRTVWAMNTYKMFSSSFTSMVEDSRYSDNASEQLADQFSARFGTGKDLTSALNKMYKNTPNTDFLFGLVMAFYTYLAVLLSAISGAAILFPVFILLGLTVSLGLVGESKRDLTYDDSTDRLKRIRREYIRLLMSTDIKDDIKKKYLLDIEEMDKMILSIKDTVGWSTRVANLIMSDSRSIRKVTEMEQLLEELGSNDIYLKKMQLASL